MWRAAGSTSGWNPYQFVSRQAAASAAPAAHDAELGNDDDDGKRAEEYKRRQ